jgi:hypothetical protein
MESPEMKTSDFCDGDDNSLDPTPISVNWVRAYSSQMKSDFVDAPRVSGRPPGKYKKSSKKKAPKSLLPISEFQASIPKRSPPKHDSSSPFIKVGTVDNFDEDIMSKQEIDSMSFCDREQDSLFLRENESFRAPRKQKTGSHDDPSLDEVKKSLVYWDTPVCDMPLSTAEPVAPLSRLEMSTDSLNILGSKVNRTPSVAGIDPRRGYVEHIASPILNRSGNNRHLEDLSVDEIDEDMCKIDNHDAYISVLAASSGVPIELRIQDRSAHSSCYFTDNSQNIINSYLTSSVPIDKEECFPVSQQQRPSQDPSAPPAHTRKSKETRSPKRHIKVVVPKLDVSWSGLQHQQQRKIRSMFEKLPQSKHTKHHKQQDTQQLPAVGKSPPNALKSKSASIHMPTHSYVDLDGTSAMGNGLGSVQPWAGAGSMMDYSVVQTGVRPLETYHDDLTTLLSSLEHLERDSELLKRQIYEMRENEANAPSGVGSEVCESSCRSTLARLTKHHKQGAPTLASISLLNSSTPRGNRSSNSPTLLSSPLKSAPQISRAK